MKNRFRHWSNRALSCSGCSKSSTHTRRSASGADNPEAPLLHKVSKILTNLLCSDPAFAFPPLVGSCSLLPALSLSPYDAPTPLPGEANLEALRMRVMHVARRKRQTRGKVQRVLRAPLPHSPPSQIVARPRATIPDNTQQQPQRHDNTLALSLGQTRRPCSPFNIRSRLRNPAA